MAYLVSNEYKRIIYSQSEINELKISFDNEILQNADLYCERLTIKSRILADDGNKTFSLNSFVAKEAELILHNVPLSKIKGKVELQVGTLVGNTYEYVPLGIFNIQDSPLTDKDKVTIKLRDNAVNFDFNYNAKELIDSKEIKTATLKEILQDICLKANVVCGVNSFNGEDIEIGFYDNTIKARNYVSMIAEQAGRIATVDRTGKLIFIDLSNLSKWQIPLSILEKYETGKPYHIERVVYESGTIKLETSDNEELDTLYLDASNLYIFNQNQVNQILNLLKDFEIDSAYTGKLLGNPAIDSYDLIEVVDDYNNNEVIFTTLANQEYTYSGNHRNKFDTEISIEQRKSNVSFRGEASFRKWAKTEIDNVTSELTISVGRIDDLDGIVEEVRDTTTSNSRVIEVIKEAKYIDTETGEVNSVKTSKGFTFDDRGLIISSSDDTYNALHNNIGDYYMDGDVILGQTTKDGSKFKDMDLFGTYRYGKERIDDEAMFIAQLYNDEDNETGFGHFYNGG